MAPPWFDYTPCEKCFRLHCPCDSGAKVEGKGAFVALFPKRSHHRDTAEGRPEGNPGSGVSSLTATVKPFSRTVV